MTQNAAIRWFADLGLNDTATAGGKGANLGELTRAGLPVPTGFVITAQAYLQAMEHDDLRADLAQEVAAVPIRPIHHGRDGEQLARRQPLRKRVA